MTFTAGSAFGDERIPAVEPEDGWEVCRPVTGSAGLTPWCALIKCDLHQLGLADYWVRPELTLDLQSLDQWRVMVRSAVNKREQVRWWNQVMQQDMLRSYRLWKEPNQLKLESYLIVPHGGWNDLRLIGRKLLTRLRCGTHELRIHTGRFEHLPVEERLCAVDCRIAETESHFLIECQLYEDRRAALWQAIDRLVNHIDPDVEMQPAADASRFISSQLSPSEQLLLLAGRYHPQIIGASLRARVMSAILIELAQWIRLREEYIDRLQRGSSHSIESDVQAAVE